MPQKEPFLLGQFQCQGGVIFLWNGKMPDYPKHDVYRISTSVSVFEQIGFKMAGQGGKTTLLAFSDGDRNLEDFMMPNNDGMVLAQHITDIMVKIKLPMAYFDFMYESIN